MSTTEIAPTPQEQEIVAEVHATVAQAQAFAVCTPDQARQAVEFLAGIADAKNRSETARKFLVGPMNRHVKAINDRFRQNTVPLDEADKLVRGKLLAFRQEEERRAAAEQARLDAERRQAEEAAGAERRAQAEEAARVEREARETEQRRQAELREAENERAREIALLDDTELQDMIGSAAGDELRIASQELASRDAARQAQERADTARRLAEEAQQREIAAKSAPAVSVAPTQLASASGSASTRKVWKAAVIDEAAVPREYLVVDQKAINAAVREGIREIPGVQIEQVDELAVRSGR